jgi:hypothetical protein
MFAWNALYGGTEITMPPELAQRLAVATGIPAGGFGKLYLAGQGTIAYWTINGRALMFAPVEHHLLRADRFAGKLRLARPLDAANWVPLIKEVLATATVI